VNVVVYGGRYYNNVQLLYELFDKMKDMGLVRLTLPAVDGGPLLLAEVARYVGVEVIEVRPQWLIHGYETEERLRAALVERGDPEMVVLLPGQAGDTVAMERICTAYGIQVWDVRELPWVPLGSGYQLGDEPSSADEPF